MALQNGQIRPQGYKTQIAQWDNLYDTLSIPAGAITGQKVFFQTPKGQGTKTISDTNMTAAGMLPAGNAFEIWYIGAKLTGAGIVGFDPSIMLLLQARAAVEIVVSNVVRHTMPFSMLPVEVPTVMTVQNQAAAAAANFIAGNRYAAAAGGFRIEKPLQIQANEQFEVRLTIDDAPVMVLGTSTPRLLIYLTGMLNKPAA
jgi:hypothetical protein